MRGENVGSLRRIACFSQTFALGVALSIGACAGALANPQTGADSTASATPSSTDAPPSLPQNSFFSSLKQGFNKDFDHEVVRGHFDQGSPPNSHRYYCLVDPKTGKRESNGVLGQTIRMPGGMTGIKDSSVSLYRCADAEKQGLLVTAGYGVGADAGSKPALQPSAAAPVTTVPSAAPAAAPIAAVAAAPPAAAPIAAAPTAAAPITAATAGASAAASGGPLSGASGTGGQTGCAAPAYRQFDFWLGDWDVFDSHSQAKVARVHVTRTLDDCVLLEEYRGSDGHEGQSFSIYDAPRSLWHQTWVTNRGQLLVIEGNLRASAMELSGSERLADGTVRLVRGTWQLSHDGVREVAVRSTDGGKTWTEWFDLVFRPHHT
jgi:hypothetical protein